MSPGRIVPIFTSVNEFRLPNDYSRSRGGADLKESGSSHAPPEGRQVTQELNVLALIKGDERYIFVYDDDSREALIDDIRDKATDPTIAISWFDAAVLTERVRNAAAIPQLET
jgi:hypothetical protein